MNLLTDLYSIYFVNYSNLTKIDNRYYYYFSNLFINENPVDLLILPYVYIYTKPIIKNNKKFIKFLAKLKKKKFFL